MEVIMKYIVLAAAIALLAGCAGVASQGGSAPGQAPENTFSYPRSPNFG
jgi:uncharacterized protein YceK